MFFGASLLFWSLTFAASYCNNTACIYGYCKENDFCVYGNSQNGSIVFTVHSASTGYVGFGIGTAMKDSLIYVGWRNSSDGIVLTSAVAAGHSQPNTGLQKVDLVPLQVPAPSWAKISFSFSRPLSVGNSVLNSSSKYIYALSNTRPSNVDSVNASYSFHDSFGFVSQTDLTKPSAVLKAPEWCGDPSNVASPILTLPLSWSRGLNVVVHGSLMFIAWSVLPVFAIFVSNGKQWKPLNRALLALTFLLSLAAFLMVFLFHKPPHFDNVHSVVGFIVLLGMLGQIGLEIYIQYVFDPKTSQFSVHDMSWWLGRILVSLAAIATFLGLHQYGEYFGISSVLFILYAIWVAFCMAILTYGYKTAARHHVSEATK